MDLAPDFYIAVLSDKVRNKAFEICAVLRKKCKVEIDLSQRNLSNQLKYANAIKAKKVIFIGEDEVKEDVLTVKNMENGSQEKIKLDKLIK